MTPAEFKTKWSRYKGKETSAYQEHFNDLCRLLGQPTPAEADPSGTDFFCFQKRVVKDAELIDLESPDADDAERGFADAWKKDCFGWEYKGKKKNLDEAHKQLQQYREALLNPPLLVVCDFDRYIIRTNFNGTVQETHEFTNDQIDRPENRRLLRACFENPEFLKPQRTTHEVTTKLAEQFARVARSLQERESVELADARTRAEITVAQRKNLRIARFLNCLIFCYFAEDTGLLPKSLFSDLAKTALDDPHQFAQALEFLFRTMAKGGLFGHHKIRHFDGHLFEDSTVFELNDEERRMLADAAEADWQFVEPSIMGTLFARGLDPDQRAALGAQYTGRDDIVTLVEPVLMAPLRREWAALKASLLPAYRRGNGTHADRARLEAYLKKVRTMIVMDPACGSGNFLYVSLQMLLDLEKEVITFAAQLGFPFKPEVGVRQLRAIEINPYAYELAQVTVQIGCLQWLRANGFPLDRELVLQVLDGFHNEDALLVPHYRSKAMTLKEAQAGGHASDTALKFYTEREWPKCDVIVSNPPFLGSSFLRRELGDFYVDALFENYGKRVPLGADLCCYWFERAREQIEHRECRRAGLLATQGIRGGANREVLRSIKRTGDIFFAVSDRDWILAGATVHVSMVGFDNGAEKERQLDGRPVEEINPNLTARNDTTRATALFRNKGLCLRASEKGGDFTLGEPEALRFLAAANPHGKPNSDVIRPWTNSDLLLRGAPHKWIIDFFGVTLGQDAAKYECPFGHLREKVRSARQGNRDVRLAKYWWLHRRSAEDMREATKRHARFIVTPSVAKHRTFSWVTHPLLPDHQLYVFATGEDWFFGILHSRIHEIWSLAQGTQLREKESGFRYTPTTCFETFPFPFPDDLQPPAPPAPTPSPKPKQPEPDRTCAEMMAAHYYMAKEEPTPYRPGSSRREEVLTSPSEIGPSLVTSAATRDDHRTAIAAAVRELNELRERWLNPPEWTETRVLEFPGTVGGPWDRYIVRQDERDLRDSATPAASNPVHPVHPVKSQVSTVRYPRLEPRDAECAAKLKTRTLTNLYNERPAWLDLAHKKLDAAVASAYGWVRAGRAETDLTDEQILERLLALNLERAAEEARAAKQKKPKASREKTDEEML